MHQAAARSGSIGDIIEPLIRGEQYQPPSSRSYHLPEIQVDFFQSSKTQTDRLTAQNA